MNTLQLETGGRPVANDDFQTLQDLHQVLSLPALLTGLGPCVVSGCRVYQTGSQYNVGAGVVWDGANLLDFTGRSNVSLPAMFAPGQVAVVDERAYQTGGTKTTIKGQLMELVAVDPAAVNPLIIDPTGAITFWQRVQEKTREIGTVEYITDTTGYDATGLGYGAKRGWALCNGQAGRADLRGQFVLGWNPDRIWDAHGHNLTPHNVGDSGGEEKHRLTKAELPAYDLANDAQKFSQDITYTSGDSGGSSPDWRRRQAVTISSGGGDQPHENRPPFYVLAARQWVGL